MDPALKLKCINPFNKINHSVPKNLSNFPSIFRSAYPLVPENAKICSNCQRQLYKHKLDLPSCDAKKAKIECTDEYHKAGVAVLNQLKKKKF